MSDAMTERPAARAAAQAIVRRLREAGFEAYFVGGCVRDVLLGLEPADWDVATSARPEDAMPLFAATREVGRHFGVLQVESGGHWIEVATFRTEGPYSDGRRPDSVAFTDARRDAERRDFTVNALFLDPENGAVLDYVGGRADLEARRLRAVGDAGRRFEEDALRLLRAIRFACRLYFEIEPVTWTAMQSQVERIRTTSGERVRDELFGMLTGPAPRRAMELLEASGLLRIVLPEVQAYRGVTQSPEYHPEGDVWEHTLRMLAAMRAPTVELALGVLLHDVGKPVTRTEDGGRIHFYGHETRGVEIAAAMLDRLRVANTTRDAVLAMIGQHMRFLDTPKMKRATLRRFVLQSHFDAILELHRLDSLGARGDLTAWELCRREIESVQAEGTPVRPLLSGHELAAMGVAPGPAMGAALRALVDAQLEGQVRDAAAARAWLQAWVRASQPSAGQQDGGA